jgi:hypothetical protein
VRFIVGASHAVVGHLELTRYQPRYILATSTDGKLF